MSETRGRDRRSDGDGRDDAATSERFRSLGLRTRDVGASGPLTRRLLELPDGPASLRDGISRAIVRFAVPSLVAASLALGGLYAADQAREPSFDEGLASAATIEVAP